jgi:hypothetical protein
MALSPYSQREEMRIGIPSSPVSNPNRKGRHYGTTTGDTVKPICEPISEKNARGVSARRPGQRPRTASATTCSMTLRPIQPV